MEQEDDIPETVDARVVFAAGRAGAGEHKAPAQRLLSCFKLHAERQEQEM